ncbi:MAG: hypothetical protein NVSMB1_23270 [Polyangiales bacterium]
MPRSIGELPGLLEHADVVLVSTGSPSFVVTREMAAAAVKRRRGRPLFFVDIAVPRNVDPRVHELDNCYRYDVDDLEQIVAEGMDERRGEAEGAERIVLSETDAFLSWARQLEVTPTIVALRQRIRSTLAAELERTLGSRLKHLPEEDRKALGVMLDSAANKLLHGPTRLLKSAAERPDGESIVSSVRHLFELESDDSELAPTDDESKPQH